MANEKSIAVVRQYLNNELVQENFMRVLGSERRARSYIMGVLVAVSEKPELQACTPPSIYTSAMRAALLGLSVDPSTKQAYLVPFKDKCTLIVGYKGLYDMAVRTGQYRWINVREIYEGETWIEDPASGLLTNTGAPIKKDEDHLVGWYAGFELYRGLIKQIQMTIPEIHEHAQHYSKGYDRKDGAWKTNMRDMERKTILRRLLSRWGYLDPADKQLLEESDENIDAPEITIESEADANGAPRRSEVEIKAELYGDEETVTSFYTADLKSPEHENDADIFLDSASRLMSRQEAGGILDRFKGNAKQAWDYVKSIGQAEQ